MNKNKHKLIVALSGFVFLSLTFLIMQNLSFYQSLEKFSLDLRYRYFNRQTPFPKDVVIVDVDDESFKNLAPKYGRWPWPRKVYKEVIEHISSGEPKAILFDFLFTEEQRDSNDDLLLGEASNASQVSSHSIFFLKESSSEETNHRALPPDFSNRLKIHIPIAKNLLSSLQIYNDFLLPNPTLLEKTPLLHSVNVEPDNDGIHRSVPLIIPYDGIGIPSLSFRGILSSVKNPKVTVAKNFISVYEENKIKYQIPLNAKGELNLNYYDPSQLPDIYHFSSIIDSRLKILEGETPDPKLFVNPEVFQNKIVILGASAMGLNDLKVTPLSNQYPGSFLHATSIANIIKNDYLKKIDNIYYSLIVILMILFLELFIFMSTSFILRNTVPVFVLLLYTALALYEFKFNSFYLPLNSPIIFGIACFLHGFTYIAFVEGRARKKMESTLSKYLSPSVTQLLINSGIDPTAEVGTAKELTILFSDLRGFTTLSEKMDPKVLVSLLNEYLSKMTDIVFEHFGTLDKFIGDAVMAFWNAPIDDEKHAYNAVITALHMVKALDELNLKWTKQNLPNLKVGIGVNTGKAIVGNIGGSKRLDYTIIGDNVNTTSRLEGLTKEYKCSIVVSQSTHDILESQFIFRVIDNVIAKGKTQALKLYEPLIEKSALKPDSHHPILAQRFNEAWEFYNIGDFKEALTRFEQLKLDFPFDGPTKVYIERCNELILEAPKEWSGVFVATRK